MSIRITIALSLLAAVPAWGQTTRPATRPAITPADQVLKKLLTPAATVARPLPPLPGGQVVDKSARDAVAPNAPAINVQREGSYVTDRLARLTRAADGQFELSFESDGQAMQDPPMVILPNLKLMAMENAVSGAARDLKFRVTGMVTEYKGRNYILLERVLVTRDNEQSY